MSDKRLTSKHFESGRFVGDPALLSSDGSIIIDGKLGWVKVPSLKAKFDVVIEAGTSIEAGWGIKAGTSIEAGWGIKAGEGIEAGTSIKAGWGIQSQLGITCKLALTAGLRVFAGLCLWRAPSAAEKAIRCGKLEGGEVAYGILEETGLPEESELAKGLSNGLPDEIVVNGETYSKVTART